MTQPHLLKSTNIFSYPIGSKMKLTIEKCKDMVDNLKIIYPDPQPLLFYCRGSSGAIISGIISTLMDDYEINIIHIKKEGESSHSRYNYETYSTELYPRIIVDDFINSGETVNAIYDTINGKTIDTLCVSGNVNIGDLEFKPNNVICGSFNN